MLKQTPLLDVFTSEINHRSLVGLLTIGVVLAHLWLIAFLMQPSNVDNDKKPLKIMEVVLLPEPKKIEISPPEPPKPLPKKVEKPKPAPKKPALPKPVAPKKAEPKKPEVKPLVKTKAPPIDKKGEVAKPTVITKAPVPVLPTPIGPVAKAITPKITQPTTAPSVTAKPATKAANGDTQAKGANSGVVPLVRVVPTYPARAASRHIEGWVKVEFMVNASGAVSNPAVVGSSPPGIFDEAAISNILKWKFKPKMVNGNPVAQRAVQTIKFTLSK